MKLETLKKFRNNTAFLSEKDSWTYENFIEIVNLFKKKIRSNEVALLICKNSIFHIAAYIACLESKTIPILLSADSTESTIKNYSELYKASFIFSDDFIDVLDDFDKTFIEGGYIYSRDQEVFNIYKDLSLLITTSGSTGSPKLVRLSERNLLSNASSIIKYLGIKESDRAITTLPMNYTFGLSVINTHLSTGASIVLTNSSLMEKSFWEIFEYRKPTTFSGVPYTYNILEKLKFFEKKYSFIKTMTQAGGKLSSSLVRNISTKCKSLGINFFVMYGQSEATARMSYLSPDKCYEKPESVGIAIPGGSFFILDGKGNKIKKPESIGVLHYKGENVSLGYANSYKDLNSSDENNGILNTGDLAKFDNDGFWYIVGREKRFIKIFGNRVNLDDVEKYITNTFALNVGVSGYDDSLEIYIESLPHDLDLLSIRRNVSSFLKLHLSSVRIIEVTSLPRNSYGKIEYTKLSK